MPAAGTLRIDLHAGTESFQQALNRASRKVDQFGKNVRQSSNGGKRFNQTIVEGSRAADDISAGFATAGFNAQGFALALRGAQNNVTTMIAATSPLLAALAGIGFAVGAVMVKRFAAAGKETAALTERTKELTKALERLANAERKKAGLKPFREAFAFGDKAQEEQGRKRLQELQNRALRLRAIIRSHNRDLEERDRLPPGQRALSAFGGFISSAGGLNPNDSGVRAGAAAEALKRITPELNDLAKSVAALDQAQARSAFDERVQFRKRQFSDRGPFTRQLVGEIGVAAQAAFKDPAAQSIFGLLDYGAANIGPIANLVTKLQAAPGAVNVLQNEAIGNLLKKPSGGGINRGLAAAVEVGAAGSRAARERGRFAVEGQNAARKTADNTAKLIELLRINTATIKKNVIEVLSPVG